MIVVLTYLQPDKKTGILSYRRKFPKELAPLIPSKSPTGRGRTELKVSLRSADINAPGARGRYAEAEQQYEAIVTKARRIADQSFDSLNEPLVRYLADRYLHDCLEADNAMRWRRSPGKALYETRGAHEEVYEDCRVMLEAFDAEGLLNYWSAWACQYADALGYLIDPRD